jgi:hypothetical protein
VWWLTFIIPTHGREAEADRSHKLQVSLDPLVRSCHKTTKKIRTGKNTPKKLDSK